MLGSVYAVVSMDRIKFKVNDVEHSVGCEVSSDVMLVDYLRNHLGLSGTKYMCREGGCGVCSVSVIKSPGCPYVVVNSCMVSITSCQDWEIKTIEDIGNRNKGYHVLQETLAKYNGSQCGYCSPAWVQHMFSLLGLGKRPTMLEIEKSFSGNICRCTGYRPIIEAFRTFGSDAPENTSIVDIEDLNICKKTGLSCNKEKCDEDDDWCILSEKDVKELNIIQIKLDDDKLWYRVWKLNSIFDILNEKGYDSYMLVCGNTAKGVYPIDEYPKIMIDIAVVAELKGCIFDQNLIVGAGVTLNELLDIFKETTKESYFEYLQKFIEHIELVANNSIRNLGSVGGNLMIKHQHNEFPSDIFLLFETVGACLSILTSKGVKKILSMQKFLEEDMNGKIIVSFILPPLDELHQIVTYKIMPRSQNAHAIVHAGFLYKLSCENIVEDATLVYGGLSPSFIRADATEKYLIGKNIFTNSTLQAALDILESELVVVENPPDPSVEYRTQLALSLFYKGLLSLCPKDILDPRYVSGISKIHDTRPLSTSQQEFDTDKSLWPLNQPIQKIEALIQCAGETKYTNDLPIQPDEVYAVFVLSTVAVGDIVQIDASTALKQVGVIAFYTAEDIPGENSFTPAGTPFFKANEEVLADGKVFYFNQPIGIMVAKTQKIAERAAKMVSVTYKNVREPVTDIRIAKNDPSRLTLFTSKPLPENIRECDVGAGTDEVKVLKGEHSIYGQVHFMMENLSCVTQTTEQGLEVHPTSQWMDGVQTMVAAGLGMKTNRIDVRVDRVGGAFGLKFSRPNQTAVACSLVSHKLNKPCRLEVPLTTCTRAVGKRLPCHTDYECKVSATGVIQSVLYKQYLDDGYKIDEALALLASDSYNNCYSNTKWDYELYDVVTDTAKNTWCRSPGNLESIAMAEHVLEHICYALSLDPIDTRIANFDTEKYKELPDMVKELKISSNYEERKAKVADFNSKNRWRKRGFRFSSSRWTPVGNSIFYVNLSICHSDGTVIITHGGIEMGQGINTKSAQICAHIFNIPMDMIQIKGNNTIIAPNCYATGGSIGSQNVGLGVRRCCEAMLERLAPIRSQMVNPTWLQLILKAYQSDLDLQTHSYVGAKDVFAFNTYGGSIAEIELDVLTGEFEVLRVDILQDAGRGVNPKLDVGQVEGAFVMGLGYWTCEDLVYNRTTGELLSDRTWNYYVPMARDIPQDFRVKFWNKSFSDEKIFGAKGVGEPPICLSVVIAFALREAIAAAKKEIGISTTHWFNIDGPYTTERICMASGLRKEDFKFT